MAKVLDGIPVSSPGRGVAGPISGMLLADPGAEVVRIEPPDAAPAPRIGQHNHRVLAEARFGPAEIAELPDQGRQPPATRR